MSVETPRTHSEDEYFFRHDQEILREKRRELDRQRAIREAQQQKELHWMKCPKCGHNMHEVNLKGIYVDKCSSCNGVFFDNGEWNLMFEGEEERPSFLTTLHSLLYGNSKARI